MKKILTLLLCIAALFAGCERYDHAIQDLNDRIEMLEGASVAPIEEQIRSINASITELKAVDAALDVYTQTLETTAQKLSEELAATNTQIDKLKSELQTENATAKQELLDQLAALKTTIETDLKAIEQEIASLKAKDAELESKIDNLKSYIDQKLAESKDWADATFATLKQYDIIQSEVAGIKNLIATINAAISDLETRVNNKIAIDIAKAIADLRAEASEDIATNITTAVAGLTTAYTEAIATAKSEITAAYTETISKAIAASEESMKAWVNKTLAEGYYDIATIDAKLAALNAGLAEADSLNTDLSKQISDQQAALDQAKEDLTAAYQEAIVDAIETNNGVINKTIADAVEKALNKVDIKLAVIDNAIAAIQKEIEAIKGDLELIKGSIATIEEQITNITASIGDLEEVDKALQSLIDDLEAEAADLQEQLDANSAADAATKKALEAEIASLQTLITALEAKDAALDKQLADLKSYIEDTNADHKDWANATFATLEHYADLQSSLSTLTALVEQHKGELADGYTAAIEAAVSDMQTAITTLETSMMSWVNKTLAEGYYDIADIDALLAALETKVADGNAALTKAIKDQQDALNKAKDELTTAYKKAITSAIEANNGVIDTKIASAVKAAQDALQSQITAITAEIAAIKADIELIKSRIATIEEQIAGINTSLADLQAMDTKLDGYITTLQTTADNLQAQITEANTQIEKVKQEMGAEIDAVEQNLLNQLNEIKTSLESQLATVKADINTLKAKDTELEGKITALQTYVDNQLAANKDWANATFATLAQYEEVQTTISGINATIAGINTSMTDLETRINAKIAADIQAAINALPDNTANIATAVTEVTDAYTAAIATAKGEIETAYTAAIATAISTLEASMKQWVNEEIANAYYTKAEIDAKLAELKTDAGKYTDEAELQAAIAAQQAKLEEAVKKLTTAYETAITTAINTNNGAIDSKIATAVNNAKEALQSQITAINAAITTIQNSLDVLEGKVDDLIARIQSIRFVPEYSDGKVELTSDNAPVTLTFLLSPSAAAQAVAIAHEKGQNVVTAYISRTKSRTRAVDTPTAINVTSVTGTADGMLTVTVSAASLPANYWDDTDEANLFIRISDGNNDIISEMIPAYYYVDYVTFSAASEQTLDLEQKISEEYDDYTDEYVSVHKPYPGYGGDTGYIEYSVGDRDTWTRFTPESQPVAFGGDKGDLHLRGISPNGTLQAQIVFGNSNISVACSGDIRTLVNWKNYEAADTRSAIFYGLFENCTVLTSAPELPATDLADKCYWSMFWGCTSLDVAPELPATTLANSCYVNMFNRCAKLTEAPELPATILANGCYNGMFMNCTRLTLAPELPATNLAEYCYSSMFSGCTSLVTAPELPATTLVDNCYTGMFMNCTSLTSAPALPATTLKTGCYYEMFKGCTKLNSVTMLATDIKATNCLTNWLENVADTGTLYINPSLQVGSGSGQIPENSTHGIPSGWTVKSKSGAGLNNFGWGGSLTGN